ncbi:MAG TPA: SRPBCC domain-containing protein [Usitatibacter sp.]|nr:SRPBCC domain-containing protein [Usitatibacter sp.]
MKNGSFSTSFAVTQSPEEVFGAVTNVRGWWSKSLKGKSANLGDEFTFRYQDIHESRQRLVEVVPDKRVVWLVLDASLNFVKDKHEWKGTKVVFDIAKKGRKTELTFTHEGLVPSFECFEACSGGWDYYIDTSLKNLITTGKGQPE